MSWCLKRLVGLHSFVWLFDCFSGSRRLILKAVQVGPLVVKQDFIASEMRDAQLCVTKGILLKVHTCIRTYSEWITLNLRFILFFQRFKIYWWTFKKKKVSVLFELIPILLLGLMIKKIIMFPIKQCFIHNISYSSICWSKKMLLNVCSMFINNLKTFRC